MDTQPEGYKVRGIPSQWYTESEGYGVERETFCANHFYRIEVEGCDQRDTKSESEIKSDRDSKGYRARALHS